MPNLIEVNYAHTGGSTSTDTLGMREMQALAFEKREAQYLLLKAPPASGKSRALMFLALDKLFNQGLTKAIVAVPERSIGSSFSPTQLTAHGFFADWDVRPEFNLCTPGGEGGKVAKFVEFLDSDAAVLLCTHATLRFAFDKIDPARLDNTLLAIDEFHHVSASDESQLGNVLRTVMANTSAHVIAMTGSYFRGDAMPVLEPADEAKFAKVTYNYYQQLNGYEHLKSLGIGYHFYQGRYTSAIGEVLDTDQKTILHIPHVHSGESTKDKLREVDTIIDIVGMLTATEPDTGIHLVKRHSDGKIIRVADLVNDDPAHRDRIVAHLREIEGPDDLDLIIALGMAKEGFDWPYCEHALTVGYRGSLTEIIQIIGRATRDSPGKPHAQFTNLIAQPDADDDEVKVAVNNMLKAITASLLMEQVVAPNFTFRTKRSGDEKASKTPGELHIGGFREPTTSRVKEIIEDDLPDLKAKLFQDSTMLKAMPGNTDPEVMNKVHIPEVIRTRYPDLNETQVEELRQHVVVDSVVKNGQIKEVDGKQFIRMTHQFVKIEDLHIELIDSVNPFQHAFEILSKSVTAQVLHTIQTTIDGIKIEMTDEEALISYSKAKRFVEEHGRKPDYKSKDSIEKRMGEALLYLQRRRQEQQL